MALDGREQDPSPDRRHGDSSHGEFVDRDLDSNALGDGANSGIVLKSLEQSLVRRAVRLGEIELEGVPVEPRCRGQMGKAGAEDSSSAKGGHGQDRA
jgi:hypothetical protein